MNRIRKYHSHKLQTNQWYREEEPHNTHENSEYTDSAFAASSDISLESTLFAKTKGEFIFLNEYAIISSSEAKNAYFMGYEATNEIYFFSLHEIK